MPQRHAMNETLFDVAAWRLAGEAEKRAFVPQGATDPAAGMDPAAGGMPPGGDPMAAMGGAPPMGAPPMDPAMMGGAPPMGAPPMDPAMMGGAPAPGAAPGGAGAGGKAKIDPAFIYMELSRVRKLLTHMMKSTGVDMPPDILDDGAVAMVAQGQMPQSAPLGQGGESEMGGGGGGLPALGGAAAMGPMEAPGGAGGGTEKPASDVLSLFKGPSPVERPDFDRSQDRIDALSRLSRNLTNGS